MASHARGGELPYPKADWNVFEELFEDLVEDWKRGKLRESERQKAKANVMCCCCSLSKTATRTLRTCTSFAILLVFVVAVSFWFTFESSSAYSAISSRKIMIDYPCNANQPELVVSRADAARGESNLTEYLAFDSIEGSADNMAIFDFDDRRYVHLSSLHHIISILLPGTLYERLITILSGGVLSTRVLYVEAIAKSACAQERVWHQGMEAMAFVMQRYRGATMHSFVDASEPARHYLCELEGELHLSSGDVSRRRPPLEVRPGLYEVCRQAEDHSDNNVLSGWHERIRYMVIAFSALYIVLVVAISAYFGSQVIYPVYVKWYTLYVLRTGTEYHLEDLLDEQIDETLLPLPVAGGEAGGGEETRGAVRLQRVRDALAKHLVPENLDHGICSVSAWEFACPMFKCCCLCCPGRPGCCCCSKSPGSGAHEKQPNHEIIENIIYVEMGPLEALDFLISGAWRPCV